MAHSSKTTLPYLASISRAHARISFFTSSNVIKKQFRYHQRSEFGAKKKFALPTNGFLRHIDGLKSDRGVLKKIPLRANLFAGWGQHLRGIVFALFVLQFVVAGARFF